MLFMNVAVQVAYWVMEHNNPEKQRIRDRKQEKEIYKIAFSPQSGDESVLEYARDQIRQETAGLFDNFPTGIIPPSKSQVPYEVPSKMTHSTNSYSIADKYQCTTCTDEDHARRHRWEHGQIDYMGRDSFDNILAKLNQTLASDSNHPHSDSKRISKGVSSTKKSVAKSNGKAVKGQKSGRKVKFI